MAARRDATLDYYHRYFIDDKQVSHAADAEMRRMRRASTFEAAFTAMHAMLRLFTSLSRLFSVTAVAPVCRQSQRKWLTTGQDAVDFSRGRDTPRQKAARLLYLSALRLFSDH